MLKNKLTIIVIFSCLFILTTCKEVEREMMVSTGNVSNILVSSADASGLVIDLGAGAKQYGHCYATTANVSISGSKTQLGIPAAKSDFKSQLTGLEPGTKYFIRAYISDDTETIYGKEISFSTLSASQPTIATTTITSITTTSAITGGNITVDGGSPVTVRGVCWSTSTGPTVLNSKTTDGSGSGNFATNLTGLTAGTTYYVRAYATNIAETAYGNELTFITNAVLPVLPILYTTSITNITQTTATSGGNITSDGGASVTSRGVCWNTVIGPTTANSKTSDLTETGGFVSSLTGLTAGTTYYVRAYATNIAGTAYGNEVSFTASCPTATAIANAATAIDSIRATMNGTVNPNGSSTVVTFEYGTSISYSSTATALQSPVTGSSNTLVSIEVSGLTPNSQYHYRVKAVNCGGTIYSSDLTFTTIQPPTATTSAATTVSTTTTTLNGTVNANNSSTTVTFEYGLTASYGSIVTASQSPVTGNTSTGVTASISGLTASTTYHFRVNASSTGGAVNGSDITFTTGSLLQWIVNPADGWVIMAPDDTRSFAGSTWTYLGDNSSYASIKRNSGSTIYKIYFGDFTSFDNNAIIIIGEADLSGSAGISFGTNSSPLVNFDQTNGTCLPGGSVTFICTASGTTFNSTSPDIYRNSTVNSWSQNLIPVSSTQEKYVFYIPSSAAPGVYDFYIGVRAGGTNGRVLRQMSITVLN